MASDVENICGLIDNNLAELVHTIIIILKFGVPLLLVIFGMLDFARGVIASKEDEIKKGQQVFIRRLISSVIVFFVVTIVQLAVGLADDNSDSGVWECAQLIMNGNKKMGISDNKDGYTNPTDDNNVDIRKQCCIQVNGTFENGGCLYRGMTEQEEMVAHKEFSECYTNLNK